MTLHHSGLYLLNCPFGFISELSFGILSQIFLIIGYGLTIEEHMFFLFSFDFFVSGAGETISTLGFGRDQEGCFATISSVLGCSVSIVSTLIGSISEFSVSQILHGMRQDNDSGNVGNLLLSGRHYICVLPLYFRRMRKLL